MKNIITAIIIVVMSTTIATAKCTKTDYAIGAGTALAVGSVVGVTAVATLPIYGPGIAAGSIVGWGFASAPFIGTTATFIAANTALIGTWVGMYAGALSCRNR